MSELITQISKLSILERIQLVQDILSTISEESTTIEKQELTTVQQNEIENRSNSIATGEAKTVTWDIIEQKLSKRYGL